MRVLLVLGLAACAAAFPQTDLDALIDSTLDEKTPEPQEVTQRQSYVPPVQPKGPECGIEYDCVPPELCLPNGDIDVFGTGGIDVRQGPREGETTTTEAPKKNETVAARSGDGYFGGFSTVPVLTCDLFGAPGRCCRKPVLDACPDNGICVKGWHCPSWDGSEFINLRQHPRACAHPSGSPHAVCCSRRDLFPPVPQACGVRNPDGIFPLVSHENFVIDARIQTPVDNLLDSEAKFAEFPWQALLFRDTPAGFQFLSGGVLVSDRHILTAAHYVFNLTAYDLQVRLGEWEVNTLGEPLEYQDYYVERVLVHPEYRAGPEWNDIAVLVLDKPVYITNNVHMACLPDSDTYNFDGRRCISTGWGKDAFYGNYQQVLKRVDLPMVPFGQCQAALRKTRLSAYFRLHKNFVCAGGEPEKDACTGDGGGPLVCPVDGHYVVAGITSWGIGCGTAGVPGVYASTAAAMPWLRQVLSETPHVAYPPHGPHHGHGHPAHGHAVRAGDAPPEALTEAAAPAAPVAAPAAPAVPAAQDGPSSADLLALLGEQE